MNPLEKWICTISNLTNDAALLFVMFNNDERLKAALYVYLMQHQQELMPQYVQERSVRAFCHLIKRASQRGNQRKAIEYAGRLNQFLGIYAQSLVSMTQTQKHTSH